MAIRKNKSFQLKTLIVIIAVVAFLLTPVARRLALIRQQRSAVSQLRDLGALVSYEHQWDHEGRKVSTSKKQTTWGSFVRRNFSEKAEFVTLVSFRGRAIQLEPLKKLRFATDLALFDTPASEELLEILKSMPKLTRLTLSDSELDDGGLLNLVNMPALKYVNAMGTDVTAAGILKFRQLRPDVRLSVSYDEEFIKQYQRLKALSAP